MNVLIIVRKLSYKLLSLEYCLFNSLRPVTHIYVGKLTNIGSDNGLSPGRRQAIIWTNARVLLIRPLGTNFSEILIKINTFLFKKMHLKMSSAKWRPFCLALNVLMVIAWCLCHTIWPLWKSNHSQLSMVVAGVYLAPEHLESSLWRSSVCAYQVECPTYWSITSPWCHRLSHASPSSSIKACALDGWKHWYQVTLHVWSRTQLFHLLYGWYLI